MAFEAMLKIAKWAVNVSEDYGVDTSRVMDLYIQLQKTSDDVEARNQIENMFSKGVAK